MNDAFVRTELVMGTRVTIEAIGDDVSAILPRAFAWFRRVEEVCSRFDDRSELRQLTAHAGSPVSVSPLLLEAVRFAVQVARESGGAFDPTLGFRLHQRGFDREHRSGTRVAAPDGIDPAATFDDIVIDADAQTITLRTPLLLDLGAVAKGLAIDLAARELTPVQHFAIDAGGDVYVSGHNASGEPWTIGIRHPRRPETVIDAKQLTNCAICTSGDYERPDAAGTGHHILDPRSGASPASLLSVTVIAPTAMAADALATAAFVLGPDAGVRFLERQGVEGLLLTASLDRIETAGWSRA